jgi:hypothetical protein
VGVARRKENIVNMLTSNEFCREHVVEQTGVIGPLFRTFGQALCYYVSLRWWCGPHGEGRHTTISRARRCVSPTTCLTQGDLNLVQKVRGISFAVGSVSCVQLLL